MNLNHDQDRSKIDEVVDHYTRVICEALNKRPVADARKVVTDIEPADPDPDPDGVSPLRQQAADALRRARQLPVGPDRNDLRQLAFGLLALDKPARAAEPADRHSV